MVERQNGVLKAKIAKLYEASGQKINWLNALPLALMSMRMSTNRNTHLIPHEMLTGRPMPVTYLRAPTRGPRLEQLQDELHDYVTCLTKIHKEIFHDVKGATEGRRSEIREEELKKVLPGDYVFIKTLKKGWQQPRREGPFKVVLATPTAVKVEGRKVWIHLNHCSAAPIAPRPSEPVQPEGQDSQDDSGGEGPSGLPRPRTRAAARKELRPPIREDSDDSDSESVDLDPPAELEPDSPDTD